MNKSFFSKLTFSFDKSTLSILYARNKAYIIPGGIILTCLFIFFILVTRQFQDLSLTHSEAAEAQRRIAILKENIRVLSQTDELKQNSQVEVVSRTLPTEKDYLGILNAIAQASARTGILVADYSFQVGDISKPPIISAPAPLTLSLSLSADAVGASRFLQELSKIAPISNVGNIQISGKQTTISVGFYYRPLSTTKVDLHTPIQRQSPNSKLLETISSWQILEGSASGSLF